MERSCISLSHLDWLPRENSSMSALLTIQWILTYRWVIGPWWQQWRKYRCSLLTSHFSLVEDVPVYCIYVLLLYSIQRQAKGLGKVSDAKLSPNFFGLRGENLHHSSFHGSIHTCIQGTYSTVYFYVYVWRCFLCPYLYPCLYFMTIINYWTMNKERSDGQNRTRWWTTLQIAYERKACAE